MYTRLFYSSNFDARNFVAIQIDITVAYFCDIIWYSPGDEYTATGLEMFAIRISSPEIALIRKKMDKAAILV